MTDKELHRLRRQDLLQLLLAQGREAEKLKQRLEETSQQLAESEATVERLKRRLDEKDKQINKLKGRLDRKDSQIRDLRDVLERRRNARQIELSEAGSIAEAALRLNGIFEVAQKAADQYLYNLQLRCGEQPPEADTSAAEAELLQQIEDDLIADAWERLIPPEREENPALTDAVQTAEAQVLPEAEAPAPTESATTEEGQA
jgi:chromosome segregation ATPase